MFIILMVLWKVTTHSTRLTSPYIVYFLYPLPRCLPSGHTWASWMSHLGHGHLAHARLSLDLTASPSAGEFAPAPTSKTCQSWTRPRWPCFRSYFSMTQRLR